MSWIYTPPSAGVTIPPATRIPFSNDTATNLTSTTRLRYDEWPSAGRDLIYCDGLSAVDDLGLSLIAPLGGGVSIFSSDISSTSSLGEMRIQANNNTSTGNAAALRISAGSVSGSGTGRGGSVVLNGGSSNNASAGGNITISTGTNSLGPAGSMIVNIGSGASGSPFMLLRGPSAGQDFLRCIFDVTGSVMRMGFFAATPIARPTVASAAAAFVPGAGVAVQDVSTFDGYTLAQVVKALRDIGLLT